MTDLKIGFDFINHFLYRIFDHYIRLNVSANSLFESQISLFESTNLWGG